MFASATSGDRENNNKFSPCSLQNISAVLDAVVDDRKNNCFEQSDGSFCGNKIVEEGEECDCGYNEEECTESCCHPRTSKVSFCFKLTQFYGYNDMECSHGDCM